MISVGGEKEVSLPNGVTPGVVTNMLPKNQDWKHYNNAIGLMAHASTIALDKQSLVLLHGRLHAFMDFGPLADLKMSCFSQASSYIVFCPNIRKQFPAGSPGTGICPLLFKEMHQEQPNHEHVLFVVHGPPNLGSEEVAGSLFCDDGHFGHFNEQFKFVCCLAFSSYVVETGSEGGAGGLLSIRGGAESQAPQSLLRFTITEPGKLGINVGQKAGGITYVRKVFRKSLAESYGLRVGDTICKPGTDGADQMDIGDFFQQARSGARPLLVEVLRDVPQPVAGEKGGEEGGGAGAVRPIKVKTKVIPFILESQLRGRNNALIV